MEVYLGFHGLGDPDARIPDDERPYWIALERFRAILALVAGASGTVGLTFDDGNRSDIEHALPALLEHRLTASFFVVTGRIGEPGYLTAEDIRALDRCGMGIGSHGGRHVRWTGLEDAELARDISASLSTLGRIIGKPVDRVSVPFGAYDRRVLSVLRRANVGRVYNSDFGPAWRGAWMVARNSIRHDTSTAHVRDLIERSYTLADHARARARQWRRSWVRHG